MKRRRLHSETTTSIFMDSPRLLLRLVRSESWAHPGSRLEPSHVAQKLGRACRLADQSRDLAVQEGSDLVLAPADRHDERLLPTFRAEPLERRQRRGPGGDHPRVLARARLADDTARAEGGPGEEIGRA